MSRFLVFAVISIAAIHHAAAARIKTAGTRNEDASVNEDQAHVLDGLVLAMHNETTAQTGILSPSEWSVFGSGGPSYTDVEQGQLGDCYFLAGMAAIAYRHPDIIENMFVERSLEAQGIFTMKFLINGHESDVAVDDWMPTSTRDEFFFVKSRHDGITWPLILEKAWAKIFGSYTNIEAGKGFVAFKAITQAPVSVVAAADGKDAMWDALVGAKRYKWPATIGTKQNNHGIVSGHAFTVLDSSENYKGYKAVRIYNPWSSNKYNGILKESKARGDYWLTFDEFVSAVTSMEVAEIRPGYAISSKDLAMTGGNVKTAFKFQMSEDKPFSVQLEWPEDRFFPENCEVPSPTVRVFVAKKTDMKKVFLAERSYAFASNVRVDLPGGKGEYVVYVYAEYPKSSWLDSVVLNTYASETVSFTREEDPDQVIMDMYGLCKNMRANGRTFSQVADIGGVFALKNSRGQYFGFSGITYTRNGNSISWGGSNEWKHCTDTKLNRCYASKLSDFTCGSSSLLQEDDASEEVDSLSKERLLQQNFSENVKELESNQRVVLTVEGCGDVVGRLDTLGNGRDIRQRREDRLFPAAESSIAEPGKNCGDSARGIHKSCKIFDHWQTMTAVMQKRGRSFAPDNSGNSGGSGPSTPTRTPTPTPTRTPTRTPTPTPTRTPTRRPTPTPTGTSSLPCKLTLETGLPLKSGGLGIKVLVRCEQDVTDPGLSFQPPVSGPDAGKSYRAKSYGNLLKAGSWNLGIFREDDFQGFTFVFAGNGGASVSATFGASQSVPPRRRAPVPPRRRAPVPRRRRAPVPPRRRAPVPPRRRAPVPPRRRSPSSSSSGSCASYCTRKSYCNWTSCKGCDLCSSGAPVPPRRRAPVPPRRRAPVTPRRRAPVPPRRRSPSSSSSGGCASYCSKESHCKWTSCKGCDLCSSGASSNGPCSASMCTEERHCQATNSLYEYCSGCAKCR